MTDAQEKLLRDLEVKVQATRKHVHRMAGLLQPLVIEAQEALDAVRVTLADVDGLVEEVRQLRATLKAPEG